MSTTDTHAALVEGLYAERDAARFELAEKCKALAEAEADRPVFRGGYIEYDDEKWWRASVLKTAEERAEKAEAALAAAQAEATRLREALEAVSKLHIVPPLMTEQARQMMQIQDFARAALAPTPEGEPKR